MSKLHHLFFFCLALSAVLLVSHAPEARAQAKKAKEIVIEHQQLQSAALPSPGQVMTLKAVVTGSRSTNMKMRLLLVRDGRLLEMSLPEARPNEFDQPTYTFNVYAPLGELSYQFVLYRFDGAVETSQRYTIRRTCLPDVKLTGIKDVQNLSGDDRARALMEQGRGLEKDLESYDRLLEVLGELKKVIKN